jgi:hypothetical protein
VAQMAPSKYSTVSPSDPQAGEGSVAECPPRPVSLNRTPRPVMGYLTLAEYLWSAEQVRGSADYVTQPGVEPAGFP